MAQDPQFGEPTPGKTHRDRPAAFGMAMRDGKMALVRISLPGRPPFLDLPGGAIDPGEDEQAALVREFGEETGLEVRASTPVGRASQYFLTRDEEAVNNRCAFFEVEILAAAPELKVEDDHELVWMEPNEAIPLLRHDAHAWAVAARLRRT